MRDFYKWSAKVQILFKLQAFEENNPWSQIDILALPVLKFKDSNYIIIRLKNYSCCLICLIDENIRLIEILLKSYPRR